MSSQDYVILPTAYGVVAEKGVKLDDFVEAIIQYVESQQGGPFSPAVVACAIRSAYECGRFDDVLEKRR